MSKEVTTANLLTGEIFPPGYFLAEELEARDMTQSELARQLGISRSEVSLVINGKRNITVSLALKLEKVLGISAETWMNFQMGYEITLMRKQYAEELKKTKISAQKKAALRMAIAHHA